MRAHTAAQRLRLAVSSGEFAPGQKLSEVAAAARLGVSRNTLRESYATLIADGVLERIPNRGVFIASPTIDDVADIYRARLILEPAAVLHGQYLPGTVGALDAAVGRAEAAPGDDALVSQANQEFHRLIVTCAGSRELDETMERLLARMRLVFQRTDDVLPGFQRDFITPNRRVLDALQADGDPDRQAAAEMLRTSITAAGVRITDALKGA